MQTHLISATRPKLKSILEAFCCVLLAFGPLYMIQGLEKAHDMHGSFYLTYHIQSTLGAFMLTIGLMTLYNRQIALKRRLDEMDKLSKPTL